MKARFIRELLSSYDKTTLENLRKKKFLCQRHTQVFKIDKSDANQHTRTINVNPKTIGDNSPNLISQNRP